MRIQISDLMDTTPHHRLCWTVFVYQAGRRCMLAPNLQCFRDEIFSPNDKNIRHPGRLLGQDLMTDQVQVSWRNLYKFSPPGSATLQEGFAPPCPPRAIRLPARHQRHEKACNGQVKCDRAVHRGGPARLNSICACRPDYIVDQATMKNHRAFRLSCRSRRVHHIGEVFR